MITMGTDTGTINNLIHSYRLGSLAPARSRHLVVTRLASLHILESVHPFAFDATGHLGTEIDRILQKEKEDKAVAYICVLHSTLSVCRQTPTTNVAIKIGRKNTSLRRFEQQ